MLNRWNFLKTGFYEGIKLLKLYPRKGRQLAFAFGLRVRLLKTLHRTARIALSGLMAVAVITACDNGDIPAPTQEPTATPTREPTPTPIQTARPGAAGLDDPLFPGLGNGGYDVSHYTVTLDIDVDANEISGRTQIEADATRYGRRRSTVLDVIDARSLAKPRPSVTFVVDL